MLDNDKRHPIALRHMTQEMLQCFKAAGRRAMPTMGNARPAIAALGFS